MLVDKDFYHGVWLAGGCAATQSDARFENRWWLAWILTWKSLCNLGPGYNALHYGDVIMAAITSQITSLTTVYSTVYSDADERKHQSSASLAFVRGIHRGPVNSPHKCPVTQKMFPFDDVIMCFVFNPNTHSPAADAGKMREMYPHHWTPLWWGSGGKWPIVVPMSWSLFGLGVTHTRCSYYTVRTFKGFTGMFSDIREHETYIMNPLFFNFVYQKLFILNAIISASMSMWEISFR